MTSAPLLRHALLRASPEEAAQAFEFLCGSVQPESISLDELRVFERHGLLSTSDPYWVFLDSCQWETLRPVQLYRRENPPPPPICTVNSLATLCELGSKWWHGFEPRSRTVIDFKLLRGGGRAVIHFWRPADDAYVKRATAAWMGI